MNMFKIQKMCSSIFNQIKKYEIKKYVIKNVKKYITSKIEFTREQEQAIMDFYSPYEKIKVLWFHKFYVEKTGKFSPYYIPQDIYLNRIDNFYNSRDEAKYLDNKCYYNTIFNGIPQPETIVSRTGGLWYSGDRKIISLTQLKETLNNQEEIFVKYATSSYGGAGVKYFSKENGELYKQFMDFILNSHSDIIVQKPLKQHKDVSAIHDSSVNTYRIISLLSEQGVKIYSSIIRIGVGGSKVDNISSGGITCGINEDGTLKKYAYKLNGERYDVHPTNGFVFDGYQLPSFGKAKELVKKAHTMVPHFKLVSWDIAIDESGEPLMIEANLSQGGLDIHQLNNGPLFGEDTKKILDEVFKK